MRAKIMQLHFALLLQLLLILLVVVDIADPIAFNSAEETGSRSTLANASVSKRDFRFVKSIYKSRTSGLIKGPTDYLIWKGKPKTNGKKAKMNGKSSSGKANRFKRSDDLWIKGKIDGSDDFLKMHAFIVRDEDIPECDTPADKLTKTRYFMCSGVILNENHVLTSATCVNQAHIHEYHIEADLGVLIGALDKNSYIIKIAHYEIHPRYVPDPNSIHHATNNIALLRLSCPIPQMYVIVPKLPSNRFDDVAHLCCSNRCKLSTVITTSENQHLIRLMRLRHLPSPMHIEIGNSSRNNKTRYMTRSNLLKPRKVEVKNTRIEVATKTLRNRNIRQLKSDSVKTTDSEVSSESPVATGIKPLDDADATNSDKKSIRHSSQDDDKSIDWEIMITEISAAKVSEKNQKILSDFVQNSMSDIMTKLLEVMTQHIANMDNVFRYFKNILQEDLLHEEDSNEKISDSIGKTVLKFALKQLSIISDPSIISCAEQCADDKNYCENKKSETTAAKGDELFISTTIEPIKNDTGGSYVEKIKTEMNKIGVEKGNQASGNLSNRGKKTVLKDNVFCPPLGSPVMANNTLVALIAYICDDAQNWVEWKYVNIIHNIRWIRKELKRNFTDILDLNSPDIIDKE